MIGPAEEALRPPVHLGGDLLGDLQEAADRWRSPA